MKRVRYAERAAGYGYVKNRPVPFELDRHGFAGFAAQYRKRKILFAEHALGSVASNLVARLQARCRAG